MNCMHEEIHRNKPLRDVQCTNLQMLATVLLKSACHCYCRDENRAADSRLSAFAASSAGVIYQGTSQVTMNTILLWRGIECCVKSKDMKSSNSEFCIVTTAADNPDCIVCSIAYRDTLRASSKWDSTTV